MFNGGTLAFGYQPTAAIDLSSRLNSLDNEEYRIDTNSNSIAFSTEVGAESFSSQANFRKLGSGVLTLAGSSSSEAAGKYPVQAVYVDNGELVDNGFTHSGNTSSRLPPVDLIIANAGTFESFGNYTATGLQGSGTLKIGSRFEVDNGLDNVFDGIIAGGSPSSTLVKKNAGVLSWVVSIHSQEL